MQKKIDFFEILKCTSTLRSAISALAAQTLENSNSNFESLCSQS